MPRFNVQHPKTKQWRCFSSIVDNWITDWMPEDEYQKWREEEYGKSADPLCHTNIITLDEALERIERSDDDYDDDDDDEDVAVLLTPASTSGATDLISRRGFYESINEHYSAPTEFGKGVRWAAECARQLPAQNVGGSGR